MDDPKSDIRVNDSVDEAPDNDPSVEIKPRIFSP